MTPGKLIVDGKRVILSGIEFKWNFSSDANGSRRKHWLLIDMSKGGEVIPDEQLELLSIPITAENPNGDPPYDIYQTDNLMTHPEGKKHIAIAITTKTSVSVQTLAQELLLPFDTGWVDIKSYITGISFSASWAYAVIRRIGNVVDINILGNSTLRAADGNTFLTLTSNFLPNQFRPKLEQPLHELSIERSTTSIGVGFVLVSPQGGLRCKLNLGLTADGVS